MNAATVSGPRSRIRSAIRNRTSAIVRSVFLHRDEYLAVAAPEQDARDTAGRHSLQFTPRVLCAGNGLAVHGEDDIARAQEAGRGAVRIDVADECAGAS